MGEAQSDLDWDTYFMGVAAAVAAKSKDPNCKVGAVMVSADKLIVATGFNGIARTLEDDSGLLAQKFDKLGWVVHAEHNAILNAARAGAATLNCTVYVNKFPCFACMQVLVQSGVSRVYTDDREYWGNDPLDGDHSGKRHIIAKSRIMVTAPNHPDFNGKLPVLKPGVRKTGQAQLPGATESPANIGGPARASQPPPDSKAS